MDNFTVLVDLAARWRELEQREGEAYALVWTRTRHFPRVPRTFEALRPKMSATDAAAAVEHDERGNRLAEEALAAWRQVNLDQRLVLAELRDLLPLWTLPAPDDSGRVHPRGRILPLPRYSHPVTTSEAR